jgi:hypothetical protein
MTDARVSMTEPSSLRAGITRETLLMSKKEAQPPLQTERTDGAMTILQMTVSEIKEGSINEKIV